MADLRFCDKLIANTISVPSHTIAINIRQLAWLSRSLMAEANEAA